MTANPNTPNPGASQAAPAPQTGHAPQDVGLPPDIPFRIGQGYDLHVLVEGRPLIIGGVHVEYLLGKACYKLPVSAIGNTFKESIKTGTSVSNKKTVNFLI